MPISKSTIALYWYVRMEVEWNGKLKVQTWSKEEGYRDWEGDEEGPLPSLVADNETVPTLHEP